LCAAANKWGRLPSDLGACEPQDNKAFMIAYHRATVKMSSYEQYEIEQEIIRKSREQ
jgi:hypothetical protein